jgi:hypothetical protein
MRGKGFSVAGTFSFSPSATFSVLTSTVLDSTALDSTVLDSRAARVI